MAVLFVPAAYLLLLGAAHVHISGGMATNFMKEANPIFKVLRQGKQLGLPQPRVVVVERVDVDDAVVNAIFGLCTVALLATAIIPIFVGSVVLFVGGIVTADWNWIVGGLACAALTLIFPIAVILVALTPIGE